MVGVVHMFLALVSLGQLFGIVHGGTSVIKVSRTPPENASAPIPEAFVSYSIEFSSFPDFAGILFKIICSNY
jgi:hypothetical protein